MDFSRPLFMDCNRPLFSKAFKGDYVLNDRQVFEKFPNLLDETFILEKTVDTS
jgi:hypothetical protein